MVTIKHIDVMKGNGTIFYKTLHNVKVSGVITLMADGSVKEIPDMQTIANEVRRLLPSLENRNDIRIFPY